MYSRFRQAKNYLDYYFKASNGSGHGTHSPFVYNFIRHLLHDRNLYPAYKDIEMVRQRLLMNTRALEIRDLGAGSTVSKKSNRTISDIARHTVKPMKFGQLLFRLAQYYHPKNIVELGTSLGLSTAYLA